MSNGKLKKIPPYTQQHFEERERAKNPNYYNSWHDPAWRGKTGKVPTTITVAG